MGKRAKNKKGKVQKITEEEYVRYVNALKSTSALCVEKSAAGEKKTETNKS